MAKDWENMGLKPHLSKQERMPRSYKEVEKILKDVKAFKGNLKTLLNNSRLRGPIFKKVYSLATNVLKYRLVLDKIIEETGLLKKETFLRQELAGILIYELIFGKGLPGESRPVTVVKQYEESIHKAYEKVKNDDSLVNKGLQCIPRYVRVNTLLTSLPDVLNKLRKAEYYEIRYEEGISINEYLDLVKNLETGSFMIDYHFKDLLVFSSNENLTTWSLFQKNHVYIQDKSSYIPVFALDPKPESVVIDACAAPGMKTIHIASLMENKGKIYAFEKSDNRFKILKKMLNDSCVEICEAECEDFYLVNTNNPKFQNLECILVDPTCSGSGMVNRMDTVTDTEDSKNVLRLQKLAGFQILLLKHALTFPSVKRVVYSTCSISEEENEYVVHEVLNHFRNMFKLVSVMPDWPFRGSDNYEFGKLCLRAHPEKTFTNGFFVAMFERLSYDEQQSVSLNNETFSNYGKSSKKKQRGNKLNQTENLNSNFVNENDNESKIFPSEENRNFLNNSSINNKSRKRKKLCIEETVNDLETSDQYQDKLKMNINSSEMYEEICDVEAENYSSYKLCQNAFKNNKGEKKKHKKKHSKKDEEIFDNLEIEAKVSSKSELSTSIISDQSNLISCDKVKKKKKKHKKEKEILDNLESIPEDHISDCELTSKLEIPKKKHKKHHKKHDRDLNEISQNADILDDQTLENYNAEEKSVAACEKLQHVQKKRKHDSLSISLERNGKEDLIYENTCETMLDTVDASLKKKHKKKCKNKRTKEESC